jgi:ABC-type Fe3+-hydroxamate transport system substrate-binding protein
MIIHPQNISSSKIYSRIISLVPSQTELLYDLGLDEEVMAVTKFCVHPLSWHKNKIHIGGTKNLKIDLIKKINPNLIIANKEENVKEQVEELAKIFDVFVTDVNNLHDALKMIKNIGTLTGKSSSALQLADKIEKKFKRLSETVSVKPKIKTAYLIWKDPFMAAGAHTFVNDMIRCCGLENVYTNSERYPKIKLEELPTDCELILLSSEPFPFKEKHKEELQKILPGKRIMLADGEMFSWYGSRLLKAAMYFQKFNLKILARMSPKVN